MNCLLPLLLSLIPFEVDIATLLMSIRILHMVMTKIVLLRQGSGPSPSGARQGPLARRQSSEAGKSTRHCPRKRISPRGRVTHACRFVPQFPCTTAEMKSRNRAQGPFGAQRSRVLVLVDGCECPRSHPRSPPRTLRIFGSSLRPDPLPACSTM